VPALKETKAYVTGGLRTVARMVEALNVVDGVGLARPLCQEPRLCKDILAGKVDAAVHIEAGDTEFFVGSMIAGCQIKVIGADKEPFDASDEEVMKGVFKDAKGHMERMGSDEKGKVYGWPEVRSVELRGYGQ
jgi:hypothetical protein